MSIVMFNNIFQLVFNFFYYLKNSFDCLVNKLFFSSFLVVLLAFFKMLIEVDFF